MIVNYKIENENFKVTFCPDNQKLSVRNKKNSYMQISKDLNKLKHDNKILLVIDKNIKLLGDIHLMGYSILAARMTPEIDEVYVSTDSKNYAREGV